VAANISVDYIEMTPIGQDCLLESSVVSAERRRIDVEARFSLEEQTLVQARGTFIRVKKEEFLAFSRDRSRSIANLDRFRFAP
jgi:hypothetical protein